MKNTLRIAAYIFAFITIFQTNAYTQCIGDNTFTGSVSTDWSTPDNWSQGCVPTSTITGRITIASNCNISDAVDYTYIQGSILEIGEGVVLTNSGTGTWNMLGSIVNNGSFNQNSLTLQGANMGTGDFSGNLNFNGQVQPGPMPPPDWNCGDLLVYAGQEYATVLIGTQCWMAQNLNIGTTVLDGNLEPHNNNVIEKYCYFNDPANCEIYGGFYSLMEVLGYPSLPNVTSTQGLCPTGWHIPTDEEWMQLEGAVEDSFDYPDPEWEKLGFRGNNVAVKLKSTSGWNNNGNGTDDFGFNALPAGMRDHDASGPDFFNQGNIAHFWSSSFYYIAYAKERQFWGLSNQSYRGNEVSGLGYSVRCLKD